LAAADHLLVRGRGNDSVVVLERLMGQLPGFLKRHSGLERDVFTTLIRIGLNLVGQDVKVAKIPARVAQKALLSLRKNAVVLEDSWTEFARDAANIYLTDLASVNKGDSLPGYVAESIRSHLGTDLRPSHLIDAFAQVARDTVYWKMVEGKFCKFGNDYARGLETLRHLGFSQVSTNPVLAAKAFEEDPGLVKELQREIGANSSWVQDPEKHAHELVMAGTLLALWPNLEVFRPLAFLVNNWDYMISFQLNPNVADDVKASLEDAKRAYKLVQRHLAVYDRRLGIPNPGKLRPNLVFKVAGSSRAAREITRELNAAGIGTNNTVTFTVTQEIQLIIDALEGKSKAVRSGKPLTRTYETNMGGRLVSHLREVEAERIFVDIARRVGEDRASELLLHLAKGLALSDQEIDRVQKASGIAQKAETVCAFRNLKTLTHEAFLAAVVEGGMSRGEIEQLEADLKKAGTLVARRVYWVFYEKRNHGRWLAWLQRQYDIPRRNAIVVLDSMDVLPASKRVPEDTYDTLGSPNMCNTEFPNHARAVQLYSERGSFNLNSFRNAVDSPPDPQLVDRLMKIGDFVRGYESTKAISAQLVRVGILSDTQELGLGGIPEDQWPGFGSVQKTMAEFKDAYEKFLARCVDLATIRPL
jgi:predicted DsbA family dithiol-disulfide isomerase